MHTYDNSQLKVFQECPFKYYLMYIKEIQLKDSFYTKMEFGTYVHKYLERFYKGQNSLDKIWDTYDNPQDELTYTKENGNQLCKDYIEKYKEEDKNKSPIMVEETLPINMIHYNFVVKCDMIYKENNEVYAMEHKTTGSISDDYFSHYNINSQICAQIYAIKTKYGSCSGVCLDVMAPRFLKRKSSINPEGYHSEFARSFLQRDVNELVKWHKNTYRWLVQMDLAQRTDSYPKNDNNYKCAGCEYALLCKHSDNNELCESILETQYEKTNAFEYLSPEAV